MCEICRKPAKSSFHNCDHNEFLSKLTIIDQQKRQYNQITTQNDEYLRALRTSSKNEKRKNNYSPMTDNYPRSNTAKKRGILHIDC